MLFLRFFLCFFCFFLLFSCNKINTNIPNEALFFTPTCTHTFTITITHSFTNSPTGSYSPTFTNTPTVTRTPTTTNTIPTSTGTYTKTFTFTITNTFTFTKTSTPTPTATKTCCFLNYPILENSLIYKQGNNVTFTITYRDTCGDWPSDIGVVVFIQGLGGYDMDLINGSDPTVGLLYRKQITLPNGSYQYYYLTEDRCDYGTFYPCQSIPNASCFVVNVP